MGNGLTARTNQPPHISRIKHQPDIKSLNIMLPRSVSFQLFCVLLMDLLHNFGEGLYWAGDSEETKFVKRYMQHAIDCVSRDRPIRWANQQNMNWVYEGWDWWYHWDWNPCGWYLAFIGITPVETVLKKMVASWTSEATYDLKFPCSILPHRIHPVCSFKGIGGSFHYEARFASANVPMHFTSSGARPTGGSRR